MPFETVLDITNFSVLVEDQLSPSFTCLCQNISISFSHSVHHFKYPVILNVTLMLTFDGNILNVPVHAHIRDPL